MYYVVYVSYILIFLCSYVLILMFLFFFFSFLFSFLFLFLFFDLNKIPFSFFLLSLHTSLLF